MKSKKLKEEQKKLIHMVDELAEKLHQNTYVKNKKNMMSNK